jgi:hypothetical protein
MSENLQAEALDYFQATGNYFWRWAEELEVVEWQDGTTVCYREELLDVLTSMVANEAALPPLTSVLLLLASCNEWADADGKLLWHQLEQYGEFLDATLLVTSIEITTKLLQEVVALPPELRTGVPKQHLFREIFSERTLRSVEPSKARAIVDEWASGRLDVALRATGPASQWGNFTADLLPLRKAGQRFEAPGSLELHLRTGLDKLPEPLPLPEPEPPAQESPTQPSDLFEQLAQDPRTAGLARLAQHLGAALRIPMHTQGASDQPLGGVSDVTNRGNFDRLLLSELAHDDLSLMARLVNNEALYLRREEPPRQDARPRFILLDTTLRMWGVPRVFALAAALAWARSSCQARPPVPVAAVALGGKTFSALDLESFEGVVAALELLDAAPHGGVALQAFARAAQTQAAADTLIITDAQLLHQPEFALALAEAKPALRFLLTVDRSGELQLYEYQNGHRVPLSAARYDLEELLFKATRLRQPLTPQTPGAGPAFLQQVPAPLYLPVTALRASIKNTFYAKAIGVLSMVDRQRVLFWPSKDTGARELLPVIESGSYCFGSNDVDTIYVLVSGRRLLRIYAFSTVAGEVEMVDLAAELAQPNEALPTVFKDGVFHVKWAEGTLVFDCQSWEIRSHRNSIFPAHAATTFRPDFGHIKRHINNGYNVLRRVTQLGFLSSGLSLVIEGHMLVLASNPHKLSHELTLLSKNVSSNREEDIRGMVSVDPKGFPLTANEELLFRRFTWPGGSEAVLDPRGLLHLRSADANIPEITLVLVLGQPTAAWASDGTVCGSAYFTGPNSARQLSVLEFNQQYLQRFIAQLG